MAKSTGSASGPWALDGVSAATIVHLHTFFGLGGFLVALASSYHYHWHGVIKNEWFGYPDEWWPSVSAVTGDYFPDRNLFQIGIALAATPRFLMLWINHTLYSRVPGYDGQHTAGWLAKATLVVGLIRTLSCAGWVFVTSTNNGLIHDVGMIVYLVAGFVYMILLTVQSNREARFQSLDALSLRPVTRTPQYRTRAIIAFMSLLPCLVYYYLLHKVHRVPGAYSYYACFEWAVVLIDVGFDAITAIDARDLHLQLAPNPMSPAAMNDHKSMADIIVRPGEPAAVSPPPTLVRTMAQTYLAFLFWSVLTSHPIVVWYFPLYNMGISGAEVFVLSMCAPMLLTNAAVRRVSLGGRRNLELLGLVALLATWSPSPVLRLLANGIGLFGSFVAWALHLTDAAAATRHEAQAAFVLGLLLNNIARIHGYSNNPVWAVMKNDALSGGYNLFGIALTFVAMAVVYSPSALVAHPRSQPAAVGWRGPAFAYGATLHGVHTLLTESGVVARWTVDGTPAENVDPLVGGVVTTAAMMLGLVAWTQRPQWAQSRFAWAAASAGVMALYALPIYVPTRASRYVAFALGNVYVAWQTMQLPAVFEQTAHVQRKRVFVVGSLVYITLFLSAIWTVAYEFVPGGFLLRERTWLVMLIQV
ncbi:hypothetical protein CAUPRSCDRAFT_6932, partial [Caulochytrium protostelioides]